MISPLLQRQFLRSSFALSTRTQASFRNSVIRRSASTSSYFPDVKGVSLDTSLGEVWNRVYTKYRYRLVWPIVGWIGFLYLTLWEE